MATALKSGTKFGFSCIKCTVERPKKRTRVDADADAAPIIITADAMSDSDISVGSQAYDELEIALFGRVVTDSQTAAPTSSASPLTAASITANVLTGSSCDTVDIVAAIKEGFKEGFREGFALLLEALNNRETNAAASMAPVVVPAANLHHSTPTTPVEMAENVIRTRTPSPQRQNGTSPFVGPDGQPWWVQDI